MLHVNAAAVEEVLFAARLATAYRHTFHRDAVLDVFGFRKHGHNEVDEPAFTQPRMCVSKTKALHFCSRLPLRSRLFFFTPCLLGTLIALP